MKKEKSTLAGFGAAFLAVLGSITCCGAPIAAGILASLGIGASQLQFLNSIQPYLIGIALLSLLIGFYRLYFKKNKSCCSSEKGEETNNKKSKIFLWLVTIFTLGMLIYTNNTGVNSTTDSCCSSAKESISISACESCSASISDKSISDQREEFILKGLSKACCIKPLIQKLQNEVSIIEYEIYKERDVIIVVYDQNKKSNKDIKSLFEEAGFTVKNTK
jgi:hypothetical protein